MGGIGILNVGAGDTKLTFDKSNPAEMIRSARIVTDMLRRGYALLIEVPGKKGQKPGYQRVHEFREDTAEYIIADLDPIQAAKADEEDNAQGHEVEAAAPISTGKSPTEAKRGRPAKVKAVSAASVSGIAVARSAGG